MESDWGDGIKANVKHKVKMFMLSWQNIVQKIAIHKMCMCVCIIYLFIYLLTYLFDIQNQKFKNLYALHLLENKIFSKRWNVEIKKEKQR